MTTDPRKLSVEHRDSEQTSLSSPVSWKQLFSTDFERPDGESGTPKKGLCWNLIFYLVAVGILILVTVKLFRTWPARTELYKSNDAVARTGFICDCSLPLNLQEPEATSDPGDAKSKINFNQCYKRSALESVNVLQFPTNNTGIDPIVNQYATDVVHYRESEGYVVSEEAHELTIRNIHFKAEEKLQHLYRGNEIGFGDSDIVFPDGYILDATFMDFPQSFVRMAFLYTCGNCSLCGLSRMNKTIFNIVGGDENWASCYYYGREDTHQCSSSLPEDNTNTYEGKCVLYPTRTLPFVFAIKKFIGDLRQIQGIESFKPLPTISGGDKVVKSFVNYTSVQSNVIYLNRTYVTQGMLQYGFLEFPKGSTLRAWLLSTLPGSEISCSDLSNVSTSVCSGSSICNAFVDADGSIRLKCDDMKNKTACEALVNDATLTVDNVYGDPAGVGAEAICSTPSFSCVSDLPAYKVTRFANTSISDPINLYLNFTTLSRDWRAMSGICTNTYDLVYRFNSTMFLEAECVDGTDLCQLTGKFHQLHDFHREEHWLGPEEFYNNSKGGELFECYKVRDQETLSWLLNYVNTSFSWIGLWVAFYVSCLYKLISFLRVRYAQDQHRPSWMNWCVNLVKNLTCRSPSLDTSISKTPTHNISGLGKLSRGLRAPPVYAQVSMEELKLFRSPPSV